MASKKKMRFAILGGGSFGTALAIHLASNAHSVYVWEFVEAQAKEMQEKRVCPMLPGVVIPANVIISSKMEEVLPGSAAVFLVIPSKFAGSTLASAAPLMSSMPLIICSKGLAPGGQLLSDLAKTKISGEVYYLSGPTHAEEVGRGKFSSLVLAGGSGKKKWKTAIESANLRVELNNDIAGAQVVAALKNIIALALGLVKGLELGDNAEAYFFTKGLAEMAEIGQAWGGKKDSFYGLAGVGDLYVTCTSQHSRNRFVGQEVGKGRKVQEVVQSMNMVAEGLSTLEFIPEIKQRFGLELPLMTVLHEIFVEGKEAKKLWEAYG